MTPYIGCGYARARLESLVDGELAMDEQVAVESHVRWCRTCAARIEDMQLIGDSIRRRSALVRIDAAYDSSVSAAEASVMGRLSAERDQALLTRLREQLSDLRLVLPAAGATMAVMLAVGVALAVLQLTSVDVPESLAARLDAMGAPGSERNPLRPDGRGFVDSRFNVYIEGNRVGGFSLPRTRVDGNGMVLAGLGALESTVAVGEESSFAVSEEWVTLALVVGRDGRVFNYWISAASTVAGYDAVGATVQQARFSPAQDQIGRPVAVDLVHQLVFVSVRAPDLGPGALLPLPDASLQQGVRALPHDEAPSSSQSGVARVSPTA